MAIKHGIDGLGIFDGLVMPHNLRACCAKLPFVLAAASTQHAGCFAGLLGFDKKVLSQAFRVVFSDRLLFH